MSHWPPEWDGSIRRSAHRILSQHGPSRHNECGSQGFAGFAPLYAGVLVGGQSSRMGRSKALLMFQGSSLLERVIAGGTNQGSWRLSAG